MSFRTSNTMSSALSHDECSSYFVPGYSISRHIIFSHIHFYLGPYASVRPYSYQGREGYLVIAPGRPLTKVDSFCGSSCRFCTHLYLTSLFFLVQSQIDDLRNLSKQYEQQAAERMITNGIGGGSEDAYINRPIQVQQRRRYGPEIHGRGR